MGLGGGGMGCLRGWLGGRDGYLGMAIVMGQDQINARVCSISPARLSRILLPY